MTSGTGSMTCNASVQPWGPPWLGFCKYCGYLCQFADPRLTGDPDAFTDAYGFYSRFPRPWHDYTLLDIVFGSRYCTGASALLSQQVAIGQKPTHALVIPVSGGDPD